MGQERVELSRGFYPQPILSRSCIPNSSTGPNLRRCFAYTYLFYTLQRGCQGAEIAFAIVAKGYSSPLMPFTKEIVLGGIVIKGLEGLGCLGSPTCLP